MEEPEVKQKTKIRGKIRGVCITLSTIIIFLVLFLRLTIITQTHFRELEEEPIIENNEVVTIEETATQEEIVEEEKSEEIVEPRPEGEVSRGSTGDRTAKEQANVEEKPIQTTKSEWLKFTATGYCPCSKCCGQWANGITAMGTTAVAGVTVAMPSKYSFGTKIEIKGMGTYEVQDRGGAIKGNRIDIFFNTHQEALNFGKKTVYLKIVE